MTINIEYFKQEFYRLSGRPFQHELPNTYEELFDKQGPDEFQNKMRWLLKICKGQLTRDNQKETNTQTVQQGGSIIYFGDLSIGGDFQPQKHIFVVGNLHVTGIIYGDIHRMIVVGGEIRCNGMLLSRSYVFAESNMDVRYCVLQHSYGFTMLGGILKVLALIEDPSCVVCDVSENPLEKEKSNNEKIDATDHINMEEIEIEALEKRLKLIVPEYSPRFTDGQWEFDELFEFLSERG